MIVPDRWADAWLAAWNQRDIAALLSLYAADVQLRSPFAKVYSRSGVIVGKIQLEEYWNEVLRRVPSLHFEKVAVYSGHLAMALHYRDHLGRNCIETILFNENDEVVSETACLDRLR